MGPARCENCCEIHKWLACSRQAIPEHHGIQLFCALSMFPTKKASLAGEVRVA
jgi:hypothetical protein